jgi:hypothetical protein
LNIAAEDGNGFRRWRHQDVAYIPTYRRERLTALYRNINAWDKGIQGHLAALLGCARTIEGSVDGSGASPDGLIALRYSFGLRMDRVERALTVLEETVSMHSSYGRLIDSVHELDSLLDRLYKSGKDSDPSLSQAIIKLAIEVKEGLWSALFDASQFHAWNRKIST